MGNFLFETKATQISLEEVGSDVGLAVIAPIDFDEVGPGGDGVVLAEADATGVDGGFGEAGPGGDAGLVAVGADEVAGAEGLAIGAEEMTGGGWLDALGRSSPSGSGHRERAARSSRS